MRVAPQLRRWMAAVAAVAALAMIAMIGGRAWYSNHAQPYSTAVGEQRAIQLPDGSVVQLNTDSRIAVQFTEQVRQVRLHEGEALFKVAKDGGRPFQVLADDSVIQALGTQFNVYRRKDGVSVAVLEGKVSVQSDRDEATARGTMLRAGEEVKVVRGRVQRIEEPDVSEAVAWRQRRLVFKVTPLNEMVMQFNRYNRAPKIRLDGIDGAARHYTGTFDADDPQSLALLLSQDPELSVRHSATEIVIQAQK